MPNLFVINGGSLNGGSFIAILGTSDVLAVGEIVASGTRAHRASADAAGEASASSTALHLHRPSASPAGQAITLATGTHVHGGGASILGVGTFEGGPINYTFSEGAGAIGTASVSAQVVSPQGSATALGEGVTSVSATKALRGAASGNGEGAVASDATRYALATAVISGVATIPAPDPAVNNTYTVLYVPFEGTAVIGPLLLGVVIFKLEADFAGTSSIVASATQAHAGAASPLSGAATILANGSRTAISSANLLGEVVVVAPGIRALRASASPTGEVTISGASIQVHAGTTVGTAFQEGETNQPFGTATLVATPTHAHGASSAAGDAHASIEVNAISLRRAVAAINGVVDIAATADSNTQARDPDARTMRRPFNDRTMRRPFVDRTMKAPVS